MVTSVPSLLGARLDRLRADMRGAQLDALLVSHLTNIRYLTSFHGSAGALVVTATRCDLVVDFRYALLARLAVEAAGGTVAVIVSDASIDGTVADRLVATGALRIGVEGQSLTVARFNRLAETLASKSTSGPVDGAADVRELVVTEGIIERARCVKDAAEIATLREAARRLGGVADEVPALVRQGRREAEVAADIDALLRAAGFARPAFETIVASGPNGAVPHARPTERRLQPDEGVVLDFGGVYDGYCVDLTRTVALGTPSAEWRRMFEAVAAAQQAAIAAVRPGVAFSQVDAAARDLLTLQGLGGAFGHATGHGIGLDVHEEPRIARLLPGYPDGVLQPGMVFTVEPGAYVEPIGGVRIEDDVLVTDDGCEVLTRGVSGAT